MTNEQANILAELGAELITIDESIEALARCEHVPRFTVDALRATVDRIESEIRDIAAPCYSCGGEGEHRGSVSGGDDREYAADCPICNGAGVVTPDDARRIGSHYLAELAGAYDDILTDYDVTFAETDIPF